MDNTPAPVDFCADVRPFPRIAVFGKAFASPRTQQVAQVVSEMRQLCPAMIIEAAFADFLNREVPWLDLAGVERFEAFPEHAAVAVSIGGDGTFLRTAARLGARQLPILGVNTGRLGFLADVTPEQIPAALSQVIRGEYMLSRRSVIEVQAEQEVISVYPFALNEVAVLKHDNSSLIEVETSVDGQLLTNYMADGLIISTPTGSTGYSLSVGGPVLAPESPTFCLAAVAPHSLTMRPIILSDAVEIKLRVKSRTGHFLLAIDGRSLSLSEGTTLTLKKAAHTVDVIKTAGNDFFHTLRGKMMWGVDQRV